MSPIQLFTPTFEIEECLAEIRKCLEIGWTGLGFKTIEFEDAWKAYTGHAHAHFLSSATAGLHLGVKIMKEAYGWDDEDEIISTPLTFVSTNHAILYAHMKVVFADIDHFGCLDPRQVESKITARTKAVMFVGLGGNAGQLKEIVDLCQRRGLKLILDAAHMAGTRCKDVSVPDIDVSIYSFQAVKNLPTADSGMICFKDEALDKKVRQLSWLGIDKDTFSRAKSEGAYKWYYDVPDLGFKEHGNSVMAAIAIVQLKYLDRDNAFRKQICRWYDEELADVKDIRRVPLSAGCDSSRHLYQIRVANRDEVLLGLNSAKIYPGVHYRTNTEFSMYKNQASQCPEASLFSNEVISLPLHLRLTYHDVQYICKNLKEVVTAAVKPK